MEQYSVIVLHFCCKGKLWNFFPALQANAVVASLFVGQDMSVLISEVIPMQPTYNSKDCVATQMKVNWCN